jgi:hypothetical protein
MASPERSLSAAEPSAAKNRTKKVLRRKAQELGQSYSDEQLEKEASRRLR